jgi:hypothetical protein
LRPVDPDEAKLFAVLLDASFLVQGFRNKDLRARFVPNAGNNPQCRRKASGRITRWLRLLRAHGLIRKVSTTSYYRVTHAGLNLMTTALKLRDLNVAAMAA